MAFLLSEATNKAAAVRTKETGETAASPTDSLTSDTKAPDESSFSELECA